MFVDVETKMNCSIDIDSSEAFRILCKTLNMDFFLDEDTKFLIEKSPEYESRIYTLKNGNKEEYDDRGDLFIALRNVAVNIFPNIAFRNDDYIYNR